MEVKVSVHIGPWDNRSYAGSTVHSRVIPESLSEKFVENIVTKGGFGQKIDDKIVWYPLHRIKFIEIDPIQEDKSE